MQIEQLISVIDAHTTGTPIRIVVSGIPRLHGKTVGEKMEYMRANFDWIRTSLLQQPRGFTSLVAAVLTEPVSEEADYGLFYMDDLTYQPMCGAGTLAVAKALVSVGMVPVKEPATEVVLETPTGLVRVSVAIENGNPGRVSLRNIPAFLYRKDLELEVPEVGHLTVDIGYGGNFFVLTDISQIQTPLIHGEIKKEQMSELRRLSRLILQEANKHIQVVHPENPAINYLDQLLYYSTKAEEDGSYLAQCIFGDAQADISPCGTGTSTRLAQKYFRGELKVGDTYRQKSVCGGVFEGKVLETAKAEKLPCSIFNDVLGPVMRGPSSSHVAGAARIASMIRQSLDAPVKKAVIDFDVNGALAASHTGHGTDMGFASGLLNMELDAPDVAQYEAIAKERGLEIEYRILDYGAEHPGNYRVEVWDQDGNVVHWEAIAVGGGMVEMQKYEGFSVQIAGDFYEFLVIADVAQGIEEKIEAILPDVEFFQSDQKDGQILYNWKLAVPLTKEVIQAVHCVAGVSRVCYIEPVLPTHSSSTCQVPFSTAAALVDYAKEHQMDSWEYALEYEACRGGQSKEAVYHQMEQILSVMEQAVETGLAGTKYRDRILGEQVSKVAAAEKAGRLIPDPIVNEIIRCITAVMESKSSMGVIVAAPTCGSCGCLPGTVIGLARALSLPREKVVQGLLVAGLVGVFFAEEATFSAEVAGCQVECGAGSGMAAAALTAMMGGTIENCMDAASVGLQNITGLACDPVGNRVEWPCLGKNIMGGSNALASANMILAGYDKVIPLDETIGAIYEIGLSLPLELRCTFGGLGKTKTAREILKRSDAHFPGEEAR